MRRRRSFVLPPSCPPRGLNREEAAEYVGVSPTMFDRLVQEGKIPCPIRVNGRTIWDRHKLDAWFAAQDEADKNPWDG